MLKYGVFQFYHSFIYEFACENNVQILPLSYFFPFHQCLAWMGKYYAILFAYCCLTHHYQFFSLQKSYNVLFNNITTYSDPKYMELNATIRRNKQTVDMYIFAPHVLPLHNFTFELLISPSSESNYTTLLKRSQSFCDFTMGKYSDPILKLMYEEFKKTGANFMSKCPIPAVRRFLANPLK